MSLHVAEIEWSRGDQPFLDQTYSRAHAWRFDGGMEVRASSAPTSVPVPMSDPTAIDPEEALAAAVASCHMLFFLALAAKAGFIVDHYADHAEALLETDDRGRKSVTRVTLKPRIDWAGDPPAPEALRQLQDQAHRLCYIANSIRGEVLVEG
ncbi:OsmC family protein [Brevundimonas balnearis]|uniref:OsmC family protein n=1 Tax=Brevundimonas balnearis TaxID=1572858 RepID=A0ABV6R213_9CAUL